MSYQNTYLQPAYDEVMNLTKGTDAATWGDSMDVSTMPASMHAAIAENILYVLPQFFLKLGLSKADPHPRYTRKLFASNPGMLAFNQGAALPNGAAITWPADVTNLSAPPPAANVAGSSSSTTPAPTGMSGPYGASTNGASSILASSGALVGVAAVVVSLLAL
jgi:hypothetical protein